MSPAERHLRLAGVTRLSLGGRGPRDAYVFDPHRLALPCWALALEERAPGQAATLLTFDRHLDLVVPALPAQVPDRAEGVLALDAHARLELDVRNVDHIVAAMEAGLISEVVAIARSRPRGALEVERYLDTRGREHGLAWAPTLERFLDRGGALSSAGPVLLDLDLDCFTTPSDADPQNVLSWPAEVIREHLLPEGSRGFWEALLPRIVALTLAREPFHCGGLLAAGRLFEAAAPVIFRELLGSDLP